MGIFLGWIVFSIVVAMLGDNRKIGLWPAFFISILLSPLIGLIVVLLSDNKQPQRVIVQNPPKKATSADELLKLKSLVDSGALTQEEFEAQKAKILNA